MDDNRWVDARMMSLEPEADWQPDAARALGRFRQRRHARARKRNWVFVGAAAALSLLVLGDMAPRACANPRGCVEPQAAAHCGGFSEDWLQTIRQPARPYHY